MVAYKVVDVAEVEGAHGGGFRGLREPLGVTAFGVNQLELPANAEGFEHDHTADGQEEVYVIIRGSGTLRADGAETALRPGHYVFCSPEQKRQLVAGADGLAWVGIGCQPGAYQPRQ
jgi:quercetin dioxygenase-like cupin family protein